MRYLLSHSVLAVLAMLMLTACAANSGEYVTFAPPAANVVVNVVTAPENDIKLAAAGTTSDILGAKPVEGAVSSKYGPRKLSARKAVKQHKGIDVSAKKGTPVVASGSGTITFAGRQGAYGKLVEIEHRDGLVTRYAHLDRFAVKQGQHVAMGQKIGTVGTTGRTTGPNLHFEILVDNKHVNPLRIVSWS